MTGTSLACMQELVVQQFTLQGYNLLIKAIIFTPICQRLLVMRRTPFIGRSRGVRGTHPPLGIQILSISHSFRENLAKLYVGAPPGELAPLPWGNPGSTTAFVASFILHRSFFYRFEQNLFCSLNIPQSLWYQVDRSMHVFNLRQAKYLERKMSVFFCHSDINVCRTCD